MRLLSWNLKHKAVILIVAVVLLIFQRSDCWWPRIYIYSGYGCTTAFQGTLTMTDEEGRRRRETKAAADQALERIQEVEVETLPGNAFKCKLPYREVSADGKPLCNSGSGY